MSNKNLKNNPLLSIILPTYNRSEFLKRAVDSVLFQTMRDWELIIWDDGSTDGTTNYCQALYDERIRYFWHENRGVSFARNRAIENSVGDYLAFLDSDDEWLPDKLSVQMAVLDQYPNLDMVFSNFYNTNLEKTTTSMAFSDMANTFKKMKTKRLDDGLFLIEECFLESIAAENFIATDTVVVKKKVLHEFGGFNETLRNAVDFELWWRLGLASIKIGYVDQVLLNRYKPAGSLSSHSIKTYTTLINALDICSQNAHLANRKDLIEHLDKPYRNAWQNMIVARAQIGDRIGALKAFNQSLKYGFRLGSLRLLLQSLVKNNVTVE